MNFPEVLRTVSQSLEHSGIAYMLTGSFASAFHGAPRSTQDIDLVIAATPAQLRTFIESLPSTQYYADLEAALEAQTRESMFNVIDLTAGWKIDFILRKSRAFSQQEFARRQRLNLEGVPLFVATAEDVIIAKLEWSKLAKSERQVEDVAGILRIRWDSLDRTYLEKWINELGLKEQWRHARILAQVSELS
jgi:hypothetical protein